jgi:hypothetical protein
MIDSLCQLNAEMRSLLLGAINIRGKSEVISRAASWENIWNCSWTIAHLIVFELCLSCIRPVSILSYFGLEMERSIMQCFAKHHVHAQAELCNTQWIQKMPDQQMTHLVIWCSGRLYLQLFMGDIMSYLLYLCLYAHSGVQHIFCFVFHRLVYTMLPVSLNCPFLLAPSVFSNVYFLLVYEEIIFSNILKYNYMTCTIVFLIKKTYPRWMEY